MKQTPKTTLIPVLIGVLLFGMEVVLALKFQPVKTVLLYPVVYALAAYGLVRDYKSYEVCGWFQVGVCGISSLFIPLTLLFIPKSPYHFIAMYAALLNGLVITGVCLMLKFRGDQYNGFKRFFSLSSLIFAALYVPVLCYALLFKSVGTSGTNWVPFSTILAYTSGHDKHLGGAMLNVIANVFLFIPFGFYVGILWRRSRMLVKVLLILLAPLLIEVIQWVFSLGVMDVDDLILNTTGGILGLGTLWGLEGFYCLVKKNQRLRLFRV